MKQLPHEPVALEMLLLQLADSVDIQPRGLIKASILKVREMIQQSCVLVEHEDREEVWIKIDMTFLHD